MELQRIELTPPEMILVMKIGMMAAQIRRDTNDNCPVKFSLADKACANILILLPISLVEFNGLADAVGGYFMATNLAVEKHGTDPYVLDEAAEMMKLVERMRVQMYKIEIVRQK